jgi:bacillopeptidase F
MLRSKPHLEGAAAISGFGARGLFVVNELKRNAAASQGPVIAFLEQRGVKYQAFWIANMIWVEGDDETRKLLARLPEVESIEPDATITLDDPATPAAELPQATADDLDPRGKMNVSRIHAPEVWDQGYRGQGVIVGVIDTGVYVDHNLLKSAFAGQADNTVDNSGPNDQNGHGTHVTGTILGASITSTDPFTYKTPAIGVAPQAKFVSCKALNRAGSGTFEAVIACIQWMTDLAPHHPQVVNMSLGGGFVAAVGGPITNLMASGTLPVVAAGNNNCSAIGSPAAFPEVVAVGALTAEAENKVAPYSSVGTGVGGAWKPDVVAQGSSVTSAWIGSPTATNTISGTSMASPAVAGVAALILSARPDLTPADVAEILKRTANPADITGKCSPPGRAYGAGLVDALKAVDEALKKPVRAQ